MEAKVLGSYGLIIGEEAIVTVFSPQDVLFNLGYTSSHISIKSKRFENYKNVIIFNNMGGLGCYVDYKCKDEIISICKTALREYFKEVPKKIYIKMYD